MVVQFTEQISEFIKNTYGCKDVSSETKIDWIDSIYFNPTVFIQSAENKGTNFFEEKHLSELPKEDVLEILRYMITKQF